ncbi:MAG: homocysteine S-methyltransferase family protein [Chloroflexi bacterium]|nr:homocysteine S-methyltransferase family protein [Chloroflexota bacterium]MCI0835492.1 homocysteine S-methyltransferase family protein [Chloroflexota bacterium]MCI0872578.1 homocysteine S-methyltransferase family protein [Chloroflexota bacterium]
MRSNSILSTSGYSLQGWPCYGCGGRCHPLERSSRDRSPDRESGAHSEGCQLLHYSGGWAAEDWRSGGYSIIGGCCAATPARIRARRGTLGHA